MVALILLSLLCLAVAHHDHYYHHHHPHFHHSNHHHELPESTEPPVVDGKTCLQSPIIYYWNATDVLCYADRKACVPSNITETFDSLDKCIKQKMPKAFPILRACHATERFCPEGFVCFQMSNGVHSCCATSRNVKGSPFVRAKYSKHLAA